MSFAPPDPQESQPTNPRRPNRPSIQDLVANALDRAIALAAQPELRLAPSGIGLTGLATYVWLAQEPQPISATAGAGGITVTAQAYPSHYVWDYKDGMSQTTYDSGRPWTRRRPGSISHTYETKGRYDLSVTVVWEARWSVNGGAWQPLGYFSTSDRVDFPVREMIALLTRGGR